MSARLGGSFPLLATFALWSVGRRAMAHDKMAIPGRLELPTYGLGNRRSIRLSYGTAEPTERRVTGAVHIKAVAGQEAFSLHGPAGSDQDLPYEPW